MTKREQRVINAFINCVERGEYTFDYACLLIEDTQRYGWLTNDAKEAFYANFEAPVVSETASEDVVETSENATENVPSQSEGVTEGDTL